MPLDVIPLEPIERGQLHVFRIRASIWALTWLAIAAVPEFASAEGYGWGLPFGVVPGIVLLLAVWLVGFRPAARWRRWGWAFTGSELHVQHGWLVNVHTIVPVARVQHIDVMQGVFQRMFGVTTLALHTAGSGHSFVLLPGIARETAESIRDAIRERIGSET
jgi:hypothetical protein